MAGKKVMKISLKRPAKAAQRLGKASVNFTATLDHSAGASYGLECNYPSGGSPIITNMLPKGLFAKWNAAHPGQKISIGDRITSVNGITDGEGMDKELDRRAVMQLRVRRQARQLTKTGQNMPSGVGCIATSLKGKACASPRVTRGVPYCKRCMAKGDPSLQVKQHPKYGKILIASRHLPKGYYVSWWGAVKNRKQISKKAMEWALETSTTPKRFIDATPFKGSQLQFTACPGPGEVTTIDFTKNLDMLLDVRASKSSLMFATLRDIPKSNQFTMMYNKDEKSTDKFFKEFGIVRADVGTPKFPALRKAKKGPVLSAKGKRKA